MSTAESIESEMVYEALARLGGCGDLKMYEGVQVVRIRGQDISVWELYHPTKDPLVKGDAADMQY
jgi:hypothetical protein